MTLEKLLITINRLGYLFEISIYDDLSIMPEFFINISRLSEDFEESRFLTIAVDDKTISVSEGEQIEEQDLKLMDAISEYLKTSTSIF